MSQRDNGNAPRILAAGLSPAWQQILVFDEFHPGEVNRAREVHRCGSGKVLNVGIALAHIDRARCRTLSVIGALARAAIEPEFNALAVDCRWVETAAETRICTTIIDRALGRTTELVENAAPLTAGEAAQFRQAFAEEAAAADVVILTGSLPAGVPPTFYRELLESAACVQKIESSAGALHTPYAVLDVRGPELLAALECRPLVVKPNRDELEQTLECELHSDDDLHAAMRELNDRGAQWVVVTHGADAVWASHQGRLYRFDPPRVDRVVNPIASGDCLAAGIAWATASGIDMPSAIRFGIGAAADNVGQILPARLDGKRIAKLIGAVQLGQL